MQTSVTFLIQVEWSCITTQIWLYPKIPLTDFSFVFQQKTSHWYQLIPAELRIHNASGSEVIPDNNTRRWQVNPDGGWAPKARSRSPISGGKRAQVMFVCIGCPRNIRTCSFSQFSPLRWNRWCCGFQNFQNYSSGVKAKRQTLPQSAYYSVQSLDQVSVGESFFPFCSKTKQATRYWQEAQHRLPQQTHRHDICWRA